MKVEIRPIMTFFIFCKQMSWCNSEREWETTGVKIDVQQ